MDLLVIAFIYSQSKIRINYNFTNKQLIINLLAVVVLISDFTVFSPSLADPAQYSKRSPCCPQHGCGVFRNMCSA